MQQNNFHILELKEKIEKELKIFFKRKIYNSKFLPQNLVDLIKYTEEFTLRGGKRIRTILMLLSFKAYNKSIPNEIYSVSIIWELLQSFLLIHDDIIDQDDMRRGGPTLHKKLETKFNSVHLGRSHALLLGDLLYLWSNILLSELDSPNSNKCLNFINKEITNVIYGEIIDIFSWKDLPINKLNERIKLIHEMKTVSYTTRGPMISGALLGGADEKEINLLKDISLKIGLAFQIKDDVLGVFGNSESTGKSISSDLEEGKLTHLISYTLEKGSKSNKSDILKLLSKDKLKYSDIEKAREIFQSSGARDFSETMIKNYTDKAILAIDNLSVDNKYKSEFKILFKTLLKREN